MYLTIPQFFARAYADSATSVDVGATEEASEEVSFVQYAGGSVSIPADSTITSLTYYACHTFGGTHLELKDQDGEDVKQTVEAGHVYALPDAVFGVPYFKMVGDHAGTVSVFLKG